MDREIIKSSLYRHYKNKWYFVLDYSTNSETREEYVTYFPLYLDNLKLFVRPKSMFLDFIEKEKSEIQTERFLEISKIDANNDLCDSLILKAKRLLSDAGLTLLFKN